MLADWLIFIIPSLLFTSVVYIIDIEIFKGHGRAIELFFVQMLFGFSFVGVNNMIGASYRDVKHAIKSSSIHMICIGVFLPWGGLVLGSSSMALTKSTVVFGIINWIIIIISPFTPFQTCVKWMAWQGLADQLDERGLPSAA